MPRPVSRNRRNPGHGASLGLGLLALGHLAVDCCAGIWPVYKTMAQLDLAQAGLIATMGSLVGNGLQIAFGLLADRGWRKLLLVGGLVLAGGVTLVPYAHSPLAMFLLVLATAVGSAAFHPSGTGAASAVSRERTGVVVALFLAGGYLGYALSQLVFTATYHATGGHTAVLLLIPWLAALGLGLGLRTAPTAPPPAVQAWRVLRRVVRPMSTLFAVQALTSAVNVALVFLLPDLLLGRGLPSWVVQGGAHFALVAGGCLSLLPAGHAADRFGARRVLLGCNAVTGLLLLGLLAAPPHPLPVLALVASFGAFNSANNVVVVAEGNRMLPGSASGVSALLMGLPWCCSAVAPVIVGSLAAPASGGSPASALRWMMLCVPLTLGASALVARRRAPA
jgi:MFS transporter, FSR family, fosmidomycin resistance protein